MLVVKVMDSRLWEVIEKLVFSNQTTILKGRLLVNWMLVMNEITVMAKKTRNHFLIFK